MKRLSFILICGLLAINGFAEKPKKSKNYLFLFESSSQWQQEDSIISITYDIQYGDGTAGYGYDYAYPYMIVKIKNKTMNTIYIDLSKCFLIKGEEPYSYYTPGETRTTRGNNNGISVNMGSIANAVGIGGIAGDLANGVNVGGSNQTSTTSIEYAQRILAIPPMAAKTLDKKPVIAYFRNQRTIITVTDFNGLVTVGNLNTEKNPNLYLRMNAGGEELKRGEHFYYTKDNSPIVMNSLISYSLTENCEQVTTLSHTCYTFQIWGISNRVDDDMKEFKPDYQEFKSILVSCKRRIM